MRLTSEDKIWMRDFIKETMASNQKAESSISESNQAKLIANAVKMAVEPLIREVAGLRDLVQQTNDEVKSLQDKLIEKTNTINQLEATLQTITQRNSELTIQVAASRDESESYSRKD